MPSHDEPRPRAGERRHLTAMFCDVVDSSRFAERLDAEDWNDIVSDYHHACEAVVCRFDGYVAKKLGDGLLVYFGWPEAHEDDAYRAVRTGLAVIEAIQELDERLERAHGIRLHVRIGIHTSIVVVGETGDGPKGEHATGTALNIASRLQGIAKPDTVVISSATSDLVRGYFTHEDLGLHQLNVANPVQAYRVIAESGAASRLDAVAERGLTPFIGRESELNRLLELWDRARGGQSQTVEISGEPGIGKSRLVKALSERIANVIVFRCSPLNSSSALFPVTSRLERLLEFDQFDEPRQKLDRLERRLQNLGFSLSDVVPLIASELSLPLLDRYAPPADLPTQKKRQQTLNLLAEWFLKEAEQQPLMAVWEDLHWADPSTIELLGLVIERAIKTPLLTLLTFRPKFQPPGRNIESFTKLPLQRLKRPEVEQMISKIRGGRSLPGEVVDYIVEKTEGVPLFVEALLQTVFDSGCVRDEGTHYVTAQPLSSMDVPATLVDLLMSRLDRLGPAKTIAQRGAVLGRAFSYDLMLAVLNTDAQDEDAATEVWRHAQQCLSHLVEAGVLRRRRARQTTYEFRHALIQDAAYKSLLKRTRQAYHLQTAEVLEAQFAQVAATQPELVAHHYTEASHFEKALDYWQKAGERARDRSANKEAIHHFDRGLTVLKALPDSESRDRRELALLVATLTPLIAVEGYVAAKTTNTVDAALALGQKLGETLGELFPVLYVQWVTRLVRANYTDALRLSENFFRAAESQQDPAPCLMGHRLRGFSMFSVGESNLMVVQEQLQHALDLYNEQRHSELKNQGYGQDPRCACEAFMSLVRWLRGYPEEATKWSRKSIAHADVEPIHTNTWGYVRCFGAATYDVFRRDVAGAQRHGSKLLAFAEQNELPVWLAYASVLHGWALAQTEYLEDGIAQMKMGLADFDYPSPEEATRVLGRRPQGMAFMQSFLLSLLAEAYGRLGRTEKGLALIDSACAFAVTTREGFWKAELHRLKGELLLQAGSPPSARACEEAEACFRRAREIASVQGAKSLELRAVMSLSRLWRRNKPADARRILAEAYDGFTEGFESVDLREARRLLHELPGS